MKFIFNICFIGLFLGSLSSSSILTTSASCINSSTFGTPCSTNSSNAWLDLYLVIDVSKGMTEVNLLKFSGQLATLFEGLTIGQTPKQSTRVGIITYASTATVQLNLTACSDATTLQNAVFQLSNYRLSNDSGTNIKSGLETVLSLRAKEKSYRPTAVMIVAANYNLDDGDDPRQVAWIMKQDGITILTIAFESSGASNVDLGDLSSPGYAYENTDPDLFEKLLIAFTQINCFCPPKSYQFEIYNDEFKNFTVFADCLYGSNGAVLDAIDAVQACQNDGGISVSVTSEQKLDFLVDVILAATMPNIKQFTIGAHRVNDQWVWFGYNGTLTQINCVCPPRTNQFIVYNDKFRNYTKFADCVYGSFGAAVDPIIAVQDCENSEGILISVESKQKLDFLVDVVIASTMPNIKQFTIGAHRVNGQWVWFGYDDTLYCVLNQDLPNNLGDYSYLNKTNGFNWNFEIQNGTGNPKPYVCQSRACDADYLCDF